MIVCKDVQTVHRGEVDMFVILYLGQYLTQKISTILVGISLPSGAFGSNGDLFF